jgi:hypothetical protein
VAISRGQGYRDPHRQAAGREGLQKVSEFLLRVTGREWREILDKEENYHTGDLRCADGRTIEVKTQPIDPEKFRGGNFVEICELTDGRNADHRGAFDRLARILHVEPDMLATARLVDRRNREQRPFPTGLFGRPEHISISLAPLENAVPFIYVNINSGLLALYDADTMLASVRVGISREIWRGAGGSNADTCGVQIAWPTSLLKLDSPVSDAVRLIAGLWPR